MKDFMVKVLRSNWYYALVGAGVAGIIGMAYVIVRVVITGRPWPFG